MTASDVRSGLLTDLLVVELGCRVAASACAGLFADLGARVIVLEPGEAAGGDKWGARSVLMAGKERAKLDWASPGDCDLAERLLDTADVVLLSSDRSDRDSCIWDRPRPEGQVVCDFTAYGHTGPLVGRPDTEALVQAMAAIADTNGNRDGPPVFSGAPVLDMETAVYGFSAILAALTEKGRSGRGQRIDMALYDVGVNALLTFIPLALTGKPATRAGNRHPTLAPWNAYPASDGWVLICSPTNDQWRRLCTAMNNDALADDPRFASPTSRFENVDAIDAFIGRWVATRTVADCVERVGGQGIPCSPIVTLADLPREPNLVHRGTIREVVHPDTGERKFVPDCPIRIAGTARTKEKPIPAVGPIEAVVTGLDRKPMPDRRVTGDPAIPARPLEGLRVVEIGMNTVAPLACRQLGALGADVIKVEPPTGDSNRINAPIREDGESYIFAFSNTDKRGGIFDLRDSGDAARLWQVIATADVVMENLKPGSLDRLGFGAADICARFPHIVCCSVNGFGYDSAYPGRPALDTVVQAMSGVMSVTPVDGVPMKTGISISDQLGGQFGLAGILAALHARRRTGEGLHLDIAMQDCSVWATQTRWNDAAPIQTQASILRTRDGYVAAEALPDVAHGAVVESLGAHGTSAAVIAGLAAAGIMATRVQSVGDVLEHPHTHERGLLRQVPTIDGRQWTVLGSPLKLLSSEVLTRRAMPALGFLDPDLIAEFGWDRAELPPSMLAARA